MFVANVSPTAAPLAKATLAKLRKAGFLDRAKYGRVVVGPGYNLVTGDGGVNIFAGSAATVAALAEFLGLAYTDRARATHYLWIEG